MAVEESPSMEQKKYVASVCPEYQPRLTKLGNDITDQNVTSCDICIHWNNGRCVIFDEVLTGVDQE